MLTSFSLAQEEKLLRARFIFNSRISGRNSCLSVRLQLLTAVSGLVLVLSPHVEAADITIPSGTTVTTTQTLTDVGDTGTVESGGTIDVTDQDGLVLANDNQTATNNGTIEVERTGGPTLAGIGSTGDNSTITNTGSITSTGDFAIGIAAVDDNATINNSGSITTNGAASDGIQSTDDDATINNTGSITTRGDDSDGIYSDDDDARITNDGTISTAGDDSQGIYSEFTADNATITNNGTITTTGDGGHGIEVEGTTPTISNTNTISTSGDTAHGIDIDDVDSANLTNSGSITVTGPNSDGIDSEGDNSVITNSGTITVSGSTGNGIDHEGTNGQVTNTGTVTTSGATGHAVELEESGNTFTNSGTVSASGAGADGVNLTNGDNFQISNSGTVTATGAEGDGIDAAGDNGTLTNTGTVSSSGRLGIGVFARGNGITVTNTNAITVSGESGDGVHLDGDNANISNSGTVTVTGSNGDGIDLDGNSGTVSNTGSMTTSGQDSNVIDVGGDGATVTNSGTLHNTGTSSGTVSSRGHGVIVEGNNATITNSGSIFADNGSSVFLGGTNATLNLNQGSLLQGLITFSDPSTATLNYAVGRTAIYTFSDVPTTIDTNGLAYSISGNVITIVDEDDFRPTTTAAMVNALTGEIAGTIENQADANRRSGNVFVATSGTPAADLDGRNSVWASPFGGYLNRYGSGGYEHSFAGIMVGADRAFSADLRAGITAGFSAGNTDGSSTVNSADSYSVFGGAYLSKNWQQTFADISVVAGYLNSDEDISVLNNMVVGGIQDLTVGYDYVLVSPSVRVGHTLALSSGDFTPSLRVRYSGLWQTGSANDVPGVTVSNRTLHIMEMRGQAAYDFAPINTENGALQFGLKAGVDGIFTLGDTVDGSTGASTLNLSVDEDDAVVRGFAKADAVWKAGENTRFMASMEGGYDSAQTLSANMRFGLKINF